MDNGSSASGSTSSSGSSTPGTLNHKQTTLQRIGLASANRRRSNPFGTDVSESKKKIFTKDSLGIVRTVKVKQEESENNLSETKIRTDLATCDKKEEISSSRNKCVHEEHDNSNVNKDPSHSKSTGSSNKPIILTQYDSSGDESIKKPVQQNALSNLLTTYVSSDSSENDD